MAELEELGLTARLESKTSLGNRDEEPVLPLQYDLGYTVPTNAINYTNLSREARAYTAVISLSRAQGTFQDFQEAFNYVNNLGGGRILVLPGTYTITKNLTMYSDVQLEGLSTADCILDFNNSSFNLSSVTSSSNIKISYLTFKNCFNTVTGTIYLDTIIRSEIANCDFYSNTPGSGLGHDIYAQAPSQLKVTFCRTFSSGSFYYADNSQLINEVSFNYIEGTSGYSFEAGSTSNGGGRTSYLTNRIVDPFKSAFYGRFVSLLIEGNVIAAGGSSLTQTAVNFTTGSTFVKMLGNGIDVGSSANSNPIILITDSNRMHFTGNTITSSGSDMDGIKLVATDFCTITGNSIEASVGGGTSYAVNISNAACDRTVVVGNFLNGLTGDTLDNGTSSVIANNS